MPIQYIFFLSSSLLLDTYIMLLFYCHFSTIKLKHTVYLSVQFCLNNHYFIQQFNCFGLGHFSILSIGDLKNRQV